MRSTLRQLVKRTPLRFFFVTHPFRTEGAFPIGVEDVFTVPSDILIDLGRDMHRFNAVCSLPECTSGKNANVRRLKSTWICVYWEIPGETLRSEDLRSRARIRTRGKEEGGNIIASLAHYSNNQMMLVVPITLCLMITTITCFGARW